MPLLLDIPEPSLPGYAVDSRLAEGPQSTVYAGHDAYGHPVVIKVSRPGVAIRGSAFHAWLRSARRLRAPGLVPVYDGGLVDGRAWFAAAPVVGAPLAAAPRGVLGAGAAVCLAVSAVHDAGLVHGNLQPSNLRVDDQGAAWVLDHGLRGWRGPGGLRRPRYDAPELGLGLPERPSADVFALGRLLYEAVAGPPLPDGGRLPELACLRADVPRGLGALIQRMTVLDPGERPTAREAARALQRLEIGEPSAEWPEPPFVHPGEWLDPVERALVAGRGAPVQVLEGPAGSGRSRVAEHVHRLALTEGRWVLHLTCTVDDVGGPLRQCLAALGAALPRSVLADVLEDAEVFRARWPELDLPGAPEALSRASLPQVVAAFGPVLGRLGKSRSVLLVVHRLEQVDPLTARMLAALPGQPPAGVRVLLLHEPRWSTPASRRLLEVLAPTSTVTRFPALGPEDAAAVASPLIPEGDLSADARSPAEAAEGAYASLATWRREPFQPPPGTVWPLTLREAPVPAVVYRACGGVAARPWVQATAEGATLAGPTARRLALPRLADVERSARALAATWEAHRPEDGAALAALRLLAQQPDRAWTPAAEAVLAAERADRFLDAHRLLHLLETLEAPTASTCAFTRARARARVSLYVHGRIAAAHLTAAEQHARTEAHRSQVRVLRAESALRQQDARSALVKALRAASGAAPEDRIRALLIAVEARLAQGDVAAAAQDLARAEAALGGAAAADVRLPLEQHVDRLRVQAARARLSLEGAPGEAATHARAALREASEQAPPHVLAVLQHVLAEGLRRGGPRRGAAAAAQAAVDGFARAGDVACEVRALLQLATLRAELGEALGAEQLVVRATHRVDQHLLHGVRAALARTALQVADVSGSQELATAGLAAWDEAEAPPDPEYPAVRVRWHRHRGELEAALSVAPPNDAGYGRALFAVERARTAEAAGELALCAKEARLAVALGTAHGLEELSLYGGLLLCAAGEPDVDAWEAVRQRAARSAFVELATSALALDARRAARRGEDAAPAWRELLARARSLGYLPGEGEALAGLSRG